MTRNQGFTTFKVVLFLVILLALGVILEIQLNSRKAEKEKILDDGWTVLVGNQIYKDVKLSQFRVPDMDKGTYITLEHTFDQQPFDQASIRILQRYSAIKSYYNGKLIYEQGQEYYNKDMLMGNGYCWINLPPDYNGGTLTIEFITSETNAFSSFSQVALIRTEAAYDWLIHQHLVTAVTSSFLFFLGIIGVLCTLILGLKDERFRVLLWLSCFSLMISIWMLANSRLMEIVCEDQHVMCTLEYLGMYLSSDFLLLFIASFLQEKRQKKFYYCMAAVFAGMEILLIILNCTNIIHFPKTSHYFQIMMFIGLVSIIYTLVRRVRNKKEETIKILLIGVIVFIGSITLELIRYRYNKLVVPRFQLNQSLIPIGAALFVLAMIYSFIVLLMARVAENLERATLYDMAYQDSLTNLKNRAWCEKIMDEYEQNHKQVSIINMDLNHFKEINDSYGHVVGDQLLIQFGKILISSFREQDCVGRMGGDEFVVILDCIPDSVIENHIARLLDKINDHNFVASEEEQISVSIGYASNNGNSSMSAWKVYEKADKHMYTQKKSTR